MQELREAYDLFDTDKTGTIDLHELKGECARVQGARRLFDLAHTGSWIMRPALRLNAWVLWLALPWPRLTLLLSIEQMPFPPFTTFIALN